VIQQTMIEKRSLLMTDLSEGDEECEHLLFQVEKMMAQQRWTDRQRLRLAFVCVKLCKKYCPMDRRSQTFEFLSAVSPPIRVTPSTVRYDFLGAHDL
jgi:hypothetical protein